MYRINRSPDGMVAVQRIKDGAWLAKTDAALLEWNEAQPPDKKLDLSDREPEPMAVDAEAEELKAILAKQDKDVSAADLKTLVLKYLRRQAAHGL